MYVCIKKLESSTPKYVFRESELDPEFYSDPELDSCYKFEIPTPYTLDSAPGHDSHYNLKLGESYGLPTAYTMNQSQTLDLTHVTA